MHTIITFGCLVRPRVCPGKGGKRWKGATGAAASPASCCYKAGGGVPGVAGQRSSTAMRNALLGDVKVHICTPVFAPRSAAQERGGGQKAVRRPIYGAVRGRSMGCCASTRGWPIGQGQVQQGPAVATKRSLNRCQWAGQVPQRAARCCSKALCAPESAVGVSSRSARKRSATHQSAARRRPRA